MLFNANKVYDRQIIEGIGNYLQSSKVDWDLYLEEDFMARLDHLDEWSGDGIIADYDNPEIQVALQKANVPVVGVGGSYRNPEDYPNVPYVATDNFELVNAAFQHLRQKGIQRFAFYGAPVDEHHRWAQERENAMLELTAKEGYECYVYRGHPVRPETWQYTIKRLADWLKSLPTPIGIVAVTDARARHLLQVCDHIGMLIPDRMSVIGIDDDEIARFLSRVSLSSVKQGCLEMGYQSARLLHKMLDGHKSPKRPILVPPERVAERQSTDYKAIADPHVMQAMHFIRQNACRGIKVDQVLDYVGVSRSNLENRFKDERGHSIHTEIQNEKLQRACKMLRESDESTSQVAKICGYPSLQYMYAVFKKHYKKTPIEDRESCKPSPVEIELDMVRAAE